MSSILDSIASAREEQEKARTLMAVSNAAAATGNMGLAAQANQAARDTAANSSALVSRAVAVGSDARAEQAYGMATLRPSGWPWWLKAGAGLVGLGIAVKILRKARAGGGKKRGRR